MTGWITDTAVGSGGELIVFVADPQRPFGGPSRDLRRLPRRPTREPRGDGPRRLAGPSGPSRRATPGLPSPHETDTTAATPATRIERDSMGEMEVPADALYGASTQRAVLNFPISGQRLPRRFLRALALIKQAAAETNAELGLLDAPTSRTRSPRPPPRSPTGRHDDHFPIDVYQTGSGTSTNTNMNEVIAHLAAARLGGAKVHPNDDVNRCQRSNDDDPDGAPAVGGDRDRGGAAPRARSTPHRARRQGRRGFWPVVKTGRTHLQDATPIRLGQEFRGLRRPGRGVDPAGARRPGRAASVPLGGTAVGTGINAHPGVRVPGVRPPRRR